MPRVAIQNVKLQRERCLPGAVICETFDAPSGVRGRGGDLDPMVWSSSRNCPDAISGPGVCHVRPADIPTTRAGLSTPVYPPDDVAVADGSSSTPGLMLACVIQEYGVNSYRIRKPFDFNSRTGKIIVDVDARSDGTLGVFFNLNITDEPIPHPGFHIAQNQETGPIPRNGVLIQWTLLADSNLRNSVGYVNVYADYVMTTVTPTFSVTGTACPLAQSNSFNRIRVDISTTKLTIWESDYSSDGVFFPNFRKIWEGPLSLSWSRGYVHATLRNHSTTKFDFTTTGVHHIRRIGFDGPDIEAPRGYEFPDNTTTGHNSSPPPGEAEYDYVNLGYVLSDGTDRAEGIWSNRPSSGSLVSPLSTTRKVDLTNATSARLNLMIFFNQVSAGPATTSWGFKYKFNSGTWRTRTITTLERDTLNNDAGCSGYLLVSEPVLLADLVDGAVNTLDLSTTGAPQGGFPPIVANIELEIVL